MSGKPVRKSPYQKYKKRPYRYSEKYRAWRSSIGTRDEMRAAAAHSEFVAGVKRSDAT